MKEKLRDKYLKEYRDKLNYTKFDLKYSEVSFPLLLEGNRTLSLKRKQQ